MLNNLPFDPRLLAGLQSVLSERAESATETKTVPPQDPPAPSSPAENQPGTNPEPATAGKDSGRDARGKFTKEINGVSSFFHTHFLSGPPTRSLTQLQTRCRSHFTHGTSPGILRCQQRKLPKRNVGKAAVSAGGYNCCGRMV